MSESAWAAPRAALKAWHGTLVDDRAGRAALRRAQSASEAFAIPAFYRLRNRFLAFPGYGDDLMLARLALAVAELGPDHGRTRGEQEEESADAPPTKPDPEAAADKPAAGQSGALNRRLGAVFAAPGRQRQAQVSPARLRLLANTDDPDLFLRLLRGMLVMVDRAAPLWDVAETVRRWHQPDSREEARRRLMLAYFANVSPKLLET